MHSLWEQEPREYNVSVSLSTAEFTEISVTTSDFLPYDGSTVYDDYNVTNITVLLSTASGGSFVSRDSVVSSSSDLLTRVTISCVTCVVLLLIVIPLIIWRCRTFQQHTISTAADKYGTVLFSSLSSTELYRWLLSTNIWRATVYTRV